MRKSDMLDQLKDIQKTIDRVEGFLSANKGHTVADQLAKALRNASWRLDDILEALE